MKLNQHLKDWKQIVSCRFPHLSLPQVNGLATWSFGMVMTQSSSLTRVSHLIAKINTEQDNVIVSADRGLYADWLYKKIVELGWHPFLRINHQGHYRLAKSFSWQPLATVVPSTGMSWSGQVTCFKTNPIDSTLLARWDDGYTDPWLILTDLNPLDADIGCYGFRSWIECSYRDVKSDGWQWHKTRLRNPDPAEHHGLAMAVALLWMVTLGGEPEISSNEPLISDRFSSSQSTPTRQISCFLNGLLTVVAQLYAKRYPLGLNGQSISFGRLFPLPLSYFNDLAFSNSS
ncbi:MAG: transposase [Pleurocapsa minor HA4230-MV1]|jgi:hypothetical protein|nr:transposase [Pleurocapsa minor HA4230-MV1]